MSDSRRVLKGFKPSPVQQNHRASVDLNVMAAQALRSDLPLPSGSTPPMWGDFSGASFQAMQDTVLAVKQRFSDLPARVRGRFQNSPIALMQFVHDPANRDEAIKLGLLPAPVKEPVKEPSLAEQVAAGIREGLKADPEANPRKGGS